MKNEAHLLGLQISTCCTWAAAISITITIDEAAAPPSSLSFMFWGCGIIALPLTLAYTVAVYSIFRGRVADDEAPMARPVALQLAGAAQTGAAQGAPSGLVQRAVNAVSLGTLVAISLRAVLRRRT